MILALLRDPTATGAELAAELGVSRPTVSTAAADLGRPASSTGPTATR